MSIRDNPTERADNIFDRAEKAEREGKVQKAYRLYEQAAFEYETAGAYEACAVSASRAKWILGYE